MKSTCIAPTRWMGMVVLLAAVVCCQPNRTSAQSASGGPEGEQPENAAEKHPDGESKDKDKDKPDFPPFDEVSEDHEKIPGFFDLYYDKKKDHLLAVIPNSMLGKDFLIASSIAGGPAFTGFMWDSRVVHWQQMDKKLVLIEPDLRYDPAEKSTVQDVVARTYTDRIVLSTPIVSKRGSDFVVDFDKVFKVDRVGLSWIYKGSVNSSLSKWAKTKGFEKNLELAVDAAIMSSDRGGTRARVHFSISELPKTDYKPRKADDRVGYFMTAIKNFGRKHNTKTVFDRYIHRWHLRKADPEADVSDVNADDQIIFYIEKTVPVQFRRYVREGILEWNKAFERIGLLNAVTVRQQTDTNEWKDIDPEDVRYNFFRWIVSGRPFAMGPSRVDPRSGQIFDADIIFDDSFIRALHAKYARLGAKGPAAEYDPQLNEFLAQNPEWNFQSQEEYLLPESAHYGGTELALAPRLRELIARRGSRVCNYAQGMAHEMAMADFVLRAEGQDGLAGKYLGQLIKEVVAHEVGHTLGLRHNFKASAWKSLEDILANQDEQVAMAASVMDYNPAMFVADPEKQPMFVTTTIGPYDEWAIEYGYRHTDDEFKSEEELLQAVAARCNEPGHAYGTDEDTGFFAPDPLVNRYDNGDDPVVYARHRMEMVKRLRKDMVDWAVDDGESYSRLRRVFDALLYEYGRSARFASRVIGGQSVNRNHKGDADEQPPFTIVPIAKQREAFDFIVQEVLSDEAFTFEPELLNKLAAGRWRHWGSDDYDSLREYPIHDRIAATQYWALFHVLNPFTISRVYDAELKVPADQDALTVPELMTRTTRAVWMELTGKIGSKKSTNRRPFISSVRRSLQRSHLNMMIRILLDRPGRTMPADAHAIARLTLKGMSQQIGELLSSDSSDNLDAFTKAHLDGAKARIDKALDAEFEL